MEERIKGLEHKNLEEKKLIHTNSIAHIELEKRMSVVTDGIAEKIQDLNNREKVIEDMNREMGEVRELIVIYRGGRKYTIWPWRGRGRKTR